MTWKTYSNGGVSAHTQGSVLKQVNDTVASPVETHVFGYDACLPMTSATQGTRGTLTYTYANDRVATMQIQEAPRRRTASTRMKPEADRLECNPGQLHVRIHARRPVLGDRIPQRAEADVPVRRSGPSDESREHAGRNHPGELRVRLRHKPPDGAGHAARAADEPDDDTAAPEHRECRAEVLLRCALPVDPRRVPGLAIRN